MELVCAILLGFVNNCCEKLTGKDHYQISNGESLPNNLHLT